MALYLIKSDKKTGFYDSTKSEITISGKTKPFLENRIFTPGDHFSFEGEDFDVLFPNPTYFPQLFKRGPQIIHPSDFAYMIFRSGIKYNSRVLEAGVGTGALSAGILWIIKEGSLTSLDLSAENISLARSNVQPFFEDRQWEIIQADIRNFPLEGSFDAAFVDIPDPWNALGNLSKSITRGGTLITYCPNFNQVENTVTELGKYGFIHIESTEIIKRDLLVRKGHTRPDNQIIGHTGFISVSVRK